MTNFIEPYTANWKAEFDSLKSVLGQALAGYAITIEHVGSTAIPGLYAKPILDIDLIIADKTVLAGVAITLQKLGYINKGEQGIPGRFAFRQASELTPQTGDHRKWQQHHLYGCFSDSLALKNHLLFRDALLKNTKLINEYSKLKIDLANEAGMTREHYVSRKTEFIISVLTSAGLDENDLNEIMKANK